jgi:Flp pilus assembly protein TadD
MSTATATALNRETSRGIYADEQMAAALAYYRAGRSDKAEAIYKKVVKKDGANAGAYHMLGLIAKQKGLTERAVQLLIKAAKLEPQRPEILCDLGNSFKALRRYNDAIKAHRMVLSLIPESPEAHSNLGSAYKGAGKAGKAVVCFESALKLRPNDPELKYNLANGLIAGERYAEAEDLLRQVVYEKPDHIPAQVNLGAALKEQGRHDAAIKRYQEAAANNPDSAETHWNLGLTLLSVGQYETGWAEYEWRSQLPGFAMHPVSKPQWNGEPLDGRTLVVHAEQGLGDSIQFSRYLEFLDQSDGDIVFAVPTSLVALMQSVNGTPKVVSIDKMPAHDVQTPLLSLPRLFNDGQPYEPKDGSYICPENDRIEKWQAQIADLSGLKVGIAWQGNAAYQNDLRRSIPLVNFEPVARLDGVQLVSLQKDAGSDQIPELAWRDRIVDMTAEMDTDRAFVDTVALMKSLDLVITSDTSIAHLAGAAGVPVWVGLNALPDWRWGLKGETSPWYSSMRLFRQDTPGDWAGVFSKMTTAIGKQI